MDRSRFACLRLGERIWWGGMAAWLTMGGIGDCVDVDPRSAENR